MSRTRQMHARHWDFIKRLYNWPINLFGNGRRDVAFRTPGVNQDLQWNVYVNISYRETTGCSVLLLTSRSGLTTQFLRDRPFLSHALQTVSCQLSCVSVKPTKKKHLVELKFAAAEVPVFCLAEFEHWLGFRFGQIGYRFSVNSSRWAQLWLWLSRFERSRLPRGRL